MANEPTRSAANLAGDVALVTGGAGAALVKPTRAPLPRRGAAVAVTARSAAQLEETVELIERDGGRALAIPADVTDQSAIERGVAAVSESLGPISLLVNNAGIAGPWKPTWETEPDDWWRTLDVNLRGSYLCARAVLPPMIDAGRGRIINVTSVPWAGRPQTGAGISAYAASKAGLTALSQCICRGS